MSQKARRGAADQGKDSTPDADANRLIGRRYIKGEGKLVNTSMAAAHILKGKFGSFRDPSGVYRGLLTKRDHEDMEDTIKKALAFAPT